MGKIDFNALKREKKAKEVNEPSLMATEYNAIWGKSSEEVEDIPLKKIVPYSNKKGKKQPFKIRKQGVQEIMASAKDIGITTPLIVRKIDKDRYQIISGHHRFKAAENLKYETVPCIVRDIKDEDAEKLVMECNIQRHRMLPSEYAEIYSRYMDMRKNIELTVQEIADKFGISRNSVYRYANLAACDQSVIDAMDEDIINLLCVDKLYPLPAEKQREIILTVKRDVEDGKYKNLNANMLALMLDGKDYTDPVTEERQEETIPETVKETKTEDIPKTDEKTTDETAIREEKAETPSAPKEKEENKEEPYELPAYIKGEEKPEEKVEVAPVEENEPFDMKSFLAENDDADTHSIMEDIKKVSGRVVFKNMIYQRVYDEYSDIAQGMSEEDFDGLAEKLLREYFEQERMSLSDV